MMADVAEQPGSPPPEAPKVGVVAYESSKPGWIDSRAVIVRLVGAIAAALLGTAAVLAGAVFLLNRPDWWRGLLGAAVISALSALASLPPLVFGLRRGLNATAAGVLVAAGLRAMVALGAGLLAVRVGTYPPAPTLLLMVVFYFALLAAESYVVARAVWNAKV